MSDQAGMQMVTGSGQDGHDPTDLSFMTLPLETALLQLVLDRLSIPFEPKALQQACEKVQAEIPGKSPSERLITIFDAQRIRGIQVSQVHWVRFDQRRLPAVIFYAGQWQLVEAEEHGQLKLTSSDGHQQTLDGGSLSDAPVLWINRLSDDTSSTVEDEKQGNLAARLVLGEIFKSKRWVGEVLVATVIVNLLAVSTGLFAMQVYDRVVPTLAYATLATLVAGMGIVICLDWALKTIRARIVDSLSSQVDKNVSQAVFDHVMHLQLDTRPRSLGTLAAQVSGLDNVRQFFTSGVIFVLVDMPFALMFIAFIAVIGGPVALVYLLLLPIAILLGIVTQYRMRSLMKDQLIRSNERQGLLVDAIQGAESIRSNNATWRFSEQWKSMTGDISGYSVQQKAISNFASVTTQSLATAAYVCAIVTGVNQIESGSMTMGALIACSILGGRVIGPISSSTQYMSQWQTVSQSLRMVNNVLLQQGERRAEQTLLMPDTVPDRLELDAVRFSYPDSPVMHLNIKQLSFKAGDRVAILGPIGSGKSTLLKVLAGLYKPVEGRVRLGDADLWEIDPNVVADHVSYLPQSVDLFKGTLRSNLTLSGTVSDSRLLSVVALLGIDRIASDSPQGLDLQITEGGDGISGGQKQLVGLARLFLANTSIWLLDEPTASLDPNTEQQVLKALDQAVGPRDILIFTTHRPGLAKRLANRVVLMHRGEVRADGDPDQVIGEVMKRVPVRREKGDREPNGN